LMAFMKALDLLHRTMCAVLHHHTAMAIEMASDGGTFVCCHRIFCLIRTEQLRKLGNVLFLPRPF
jgi:hypothetical protein